MTESDIEENSSKKNGDSKTLESSKATSVSEPVSENSTSDTSDDKFQATPSKASAEKNPADSPSSNENSKSVNSERKKVKSAERKRRSGLLRAVLILAVLFILVAVATGVVWVWLDKKFSQVESDQAISAQQFASSVDLKRSTEEIQTRLSSMQNENNSLRNKVDVLERRVKSHNLRLLSLSTTSRDDWLLAEAEYLLKLANQRVLIERKSEAAIGLLEEADGILRDLANPDLIELRKAIKDDLIALKLSEKVDAEGLYLDISALAEKVESLPLVPKSYDYKVEDPSEDQLEKPVEQKSAFKRFLASFSEYVRVIDHSEKPEAILPPEATAYLHMNLRFMLERTQIALLREQQNIYEKNLSQAIRWVDTYFPSSREGDEYLKLLTQLSEKNIVVTLPDISNSLELLHSYIATLHTLGNESEATKSLPLNKEVKEAI